MSRVLSNKKNSRSNKKFNKLRKLRNRKLNLFQNQRKRRTKENNRRKRSNKMLMKKIGKKLWPIMSQKCLRKIHVKSAIKKSHQ